MKHVPLWEYESNITLSLRQGYSKDIEMIGLMVAKTAEYNVYINNPLYLDILKEHVDSADNILIYSNMEHTYVPIQKLLDKDISDFKKKNLCKLFMGHSFPDEVYRNNKKS